MGCKKVLQPATSYCEVAVRNRENSSRKGVAASRELREAAVRKQESGSRKVLRLVASYCDATTVNKAVPPTEQERNLLVARYSRATTKTVGSSASEAMPAPEQGDGDLRSG